MSTLRSIQTTSVLLMLILSKLGFAHPGDHHSIAELNVLLAENPGEQSLLVARGALYTRTGQWIKAEQDLRQAQIPDSEKEVAFELGRLYYNMGDYLKAWGYFDTYLSLYPGYAPAYLLRARSAKELNQFEAAIESYLTYLDMTPQPQPGEYVESAQLFAAIGNRARALDMLDSGMKKLGLNPQLQRYAMELELERGEPNLALTRWYSLEGYLGRTAQWTMTLGKLLIIANKVEEAKLVISKARTQLSKQKSTSAREAIRQELDRLEKIPG